MVVNRIIAYNREDYLITMELKMLRLFYSCLEITPVKLNLNFQEGDFKFSINTG